MKTLIRSFGGGEITPELIERLDLTKNQTGLETCLNFEVRPHGPVVNRAGFEYVIHSKDSSKRCVMIPFIFSPTQAYILEFGDAYVRFHTLGSTVLYNARGITNITREAQGVLTYAGGDPSNGDWLFIDGVGGMVELNGRYVVVSDVNTGANTFKLKNTEGAYINTVLYTPYDVGGTTTQVYEIASPYAEADIDALEFAQSNDVLTISHTSYQTRELVRSGATSWAFNTLTVTPTQVAPTLPVVTPHASGAVTYDYAVTAIKTGDLEESLKVTASNVACQDLNVADAFNTVTWTNAAGAIRYNVYRKINGLYGYVGQSSDGTIGFVDNNITPDISQTPPETDDPISTANNYPGAVGYYQSRRWFAGSNNKPQNVWATRSTTESNMTYSIPTRDSDAITARLTSRQSNLIRHLVPLGDLLALTSGAEWLINAGGQTGVITPSNIDYRPQGYTGASKTRPVVTDSSVLYSAEKGAHIREVVFKWETQGYASNDISIMAPHLFDGFTIDSMAFVRGPHPTLWCVRSDGKLLGLTYLPEHKVAAWHQHDTAGTFESIAAIPEGNDDVLYAVVKRTIQNSTRRYIERKHSRAFATLSDTFIVDSGLQYSGTPATVIRGLWHLVGQTVSILGDGAVYPPQVVSAEGTVTLQSPGLLAAPTVSKASIGLAYNCDIKTLPLAYEIAAFGAGVKKNMNKAFLRVKDSSGIKAGPAFDKLREAPIRTDENYGSPPALQTGQIEIVLESSWGLDAALCVRQDKPLPITVLGIAPDTTLGG